ncbi:DNA-3-methyladenine glycosylase [Raineya orbicola]|jgi:DNA-3-methyladenine glycosylase|uniref:Putative 3-methyladenine DNA glycosylase n=1 Tax=Raineya orbicola TaxID=2016530 RepID=A0A2N3IK38_9BACT|nr:3mg: DNA-3-methyladenine glycosylase [Raineya orbicola]
MQKLSKEFYTRDDVVQIAKDLLGKYLFTKINGVITAGKIVETEAYCGKTDKACHAHRNRYTERTRIMFEEGGRAYVYLCYGMHSLFNVVTNIKGEADAVLVRAIEPVEGIEIMLERRNFAKIKPQLTAGPGALSQALGIGREHYGEILWGDTIWIAENQFCRENFEILTSTRVGIAYAQEDAFLPWRFRIKGNAWVSRAKGVGE